MLSGVFVTSCILLVSMVEAAPYPKVMVDMSYAFDEATIYWPNTKHFELEVVINGTDAIPGIWAQAEEYTAGTHSGTHMDAPAHFVKGGQTIDEIPASTFIAPAAVVDIAGRASVDPDVELLVDDLLEWERVTGHSLDGTVLLLRTGWGRKWGNRTAYYGTPEVDNPELHFPSFSVEACRWLVQNRQVNGVGVDTMSLDVGIAKTFPCHQILLGAGLFGLENVANMDQLPLYGAKLHVMPMKIGKASGAPTRIIATYPRVMFKQNINSVPLSNALST